MPASVSGLTSGAEIIGLKEFRRALREVGPAWPKELRAVHAQISRRGEALSQSQARGMGGIQAKAASAIRGRANQSEARIAVSPSRSAPMANVAFWGAKRHTGWYAAPQYASGPAQHPPWVGNTWDVAVAGTGPYAINDALARYLPELLDQYLKMLDRLFDRAYPGGAAAGAPAAGLVKA